MRIMQLLPTISYGDAVGNDAIAIQNLIKKKGYKTAIYAQNIDSRLPKGTADYTNKLPYLHKDDIILYHFSTGTDLNYKLDQFSCRKVLIYHNITPCQYFKNYNKMMYDLTYIGREGLHYLKNKVEYCLAVSEYNKQDLINVGYTCPIDVLPILIPFDDYKKEPDPFIIKKYDDDWVNIIFVGRIAPNKKQEDVIKDFYYYKTFLNPKSRLIFVGSYKGMEPYYERLLSYTKELGLKDVIFTGHIKFDQILAYYKLADVFLCMSDHEGFCVPLVEAMCFEVPIIAYNCAAIPYTLGGSGLLVNEKDPVFIAKLIERLIEDQDLRKTVILSQNERLKEFSPEKVGGSFMKYLKTFINSK